jgi:hypothetical protein
MGKEESQVMGHQKAHVVVKKVSKVKKGLVSIHALLYF